ncbi:uncharacterized protein LDX57_000645 [Aspergillus melleus]|uniref:uncharacterized protein n=1 Tax=Aspergillus melleus TaxID=138277 RepID=UPI001E8DF4D3|nr:uncharacterized protein LDX57_000645 [Aspergillus melleus]KAH8422889.1 hypothetical protein LDX57_000645 [Aspergillus melleus]
MAPAAGLDWELANVYLRLKDSLQAFSSSIAGLLSSRAVLQGELFAPKSNMFKEKLTVL